MLMLEEMASKSVRVYVKEGSCGDIKKAMKSPALREYAREIAKSAVKYNDINN